MLPDGTAVPIKIGDYRQLSDALLQARVDSGSAFEPVETVLHGPVRDQAELHGLIDRIRALGLELVEVRRLPT